jgi:hypothetical protein
MKRYRICETVVLMCDDGHSALLAALLIFVLYLSSVIVLMMPEARADTKVWKARRKPGSVAM